MSCGILAGVCDGPSSEVIMLPLIALPISCLSVSPIFNFIVNSRGRRRVLRSAARRFNVGAGSMVGVA